MWPSAGAPTLGSASATICAPSSGVNARSSLSNPTSCFRPGRRRSGSVSERLPTKSGFDIATILPMPRSSGVTVPSVSCPTMMKPFSARNASRTSMPYATAPRFSPSAHIASNTPSAWSEGALTSKPNSPVKLTRASLTGTPQANPSRTLRCGNASAERSTPDTSGAMMLRASGPLIAIVANCSVMEVKRVFRSVHSVWR